MILIKPNFQKLKKITQKELAEHNTRYSLWIAIDGCVYDLSCYAEKHPGGIEKLMDLAGKDGTEEFMKNHSWVNHNYLVGKLHIGYIDYKD